MTRRLSLFAAAPIAAVLTGFALTVSGAAQAPASKPASPVVAHEWGTFTSIAAPDGRAASWQPLAGDQDLPCFVERYPNFPEVKIFMGTVRMETPVIYFYAPAETTVSVSVKFPQGTMSEWYPHAVVPTYPAYILGQPGTGAIDWPRVRITPGAAEHFPLAGSTDSHYYAARATDASPVVVEGAQEKFLFYRGLGAFQPPISATIDAGGRVTVRATSPAPLGDVIVFENRGGEMAYQVKSFPGSMGTFTPFAHNGEAIAPLDELERILIAQGLYAKEAKAMVATWRDSWFEEGTRVFYIAPKVFVDQTLPLAITPAPAAVARVFVGRMELVTADREAAVRTALERRDTATLLKSGRFLLPIRNRIFDKLDEPARKPLAEALSAVYAAAASEAPRCAASR